VAIIDDLQALLQARGRPVIRLECADQPTLQAGLAKAGMDILARLEAGRTVQAASDWHSAQRSRHG